MGEPVLSTLVDGVRTITLNRPERLNAMNRALIDAARDAFAEANADPETRAVVFTGAGERAFCAGDDLHEHDGSAPESEHRAMIEALQQVTREIVLGPKVVVGAINGWAVGGGFEWAINCDLPIWAESARAFFPELQWGLFVTGAVTALLPRIVGLTTAREMLMLGERYDAVTLHRLGVAWRVVPDADLRAEAAAVAARLAALPPVALQDMKRALARVAQNEIETALAVETEATLRGALDPETAERIAGFARR